MSEQQPFRDWLSERSLWQVGISYAVSAWVVLEVTATLGEVAGLPPWVSRLVLGLLAVGLALVLATAALQRGVHRRFRPGSLAARLSEVLTWRNVAVAGVTGFALVGVAGTASFARDRLGPVGPDAPGARGVRWAQEMALPQILQHVEEGRLTEAYSLALVAERHIPESPILQLAWADISRYTSVRTVPPGALVEIHPYDGPEGDWWTLGTTPLDPVRIPAGLFHWRISLSGYETVEMVSSGIRFPLDGAHEGLELVPDDGATDDMVRVPGGETSLAIPGLFNEPAVDVAPFWIDRTEVTNRAFEEFVDAGGYRSPEFWAEPFVRDGATLDFEDAVEALVDQTGLPGPSTWAGGKYREGEADHPVSGVSWYEAAAFARFAGKALPSIYHWHRASGADLAAALLPESNFGGEGLRAVGAHHGVGPFGTRDMAGNAREWVYNGDDGRRYILGGAWNEPAYLFREAETRSPWDREDANGFRLMSADSAPETRREVTRRVGSADARDVSDEVRAAYAALYAYDAAPLEPVIQRRETAPDWTLERVAFQAAYGGERVAALLYLPRSAEPPFQTVVVFPGSSALLGGPVEASTHELIPYLVRSGRAVILPVYKGTYERATGLPDDDPDLSSNYRDHVIMWSKDLGRTIDYLETRSDIDPERIAYYGVSWGAGLGSLLPALETRLRVLILQAGGFWSSPTRPEVDQRVFAPSIDAPVLMLNGRLDAFFPLESSQLPMYHAFATPDAHKRHVVFESGHAVPSLQAVRSMFDWLDRYLGAVAPARGGR